MLHADPMAQNESTEFGPDRPEHITTTRPCAIMESESPEIQSCCKLFDGIFRRSNIQQIMLLMKYSLDLSNPWTSQYYQGHEDNETKQTVGNTRDLYKVWPAEHDDELLKLFSTAGNLNFLQSFG